MRRLRRLLAHWAQGPAPAPPTPPGGWTHLDLMEGALQHLRDKGFRPSTVLDIGAAKGYWSQRAGWLFPDARFYLFDPLAESEPSLRALSERDPRFQYFLTALGREPGRHRINVSHDLEGSSLLEFPGYDESGQRQVPVETIDGLLKDGRIPAPELVKLDVQGFELEVLAGGQALMGVTSVFIVEVNLFQFMPLCPLAHEVVAHFARHGYRLFDLAGLLRRPFENDLGQMDLVFVSERSPLVAQTRWS